jgi:hypothetical protein
VGTVRRSIAGVVIAGVLGLGLAIVQPNPPAAEAWKPPTHLFGTETALTDALDGTVTIPSADGTTTTDAAVNDTVRQALTQFPEVYRAGTIGPDAFPDLLFGQSQIHPDTKTKNDTAPPTSPDTAQSFEWLQFLWEQAWDPGQAADERLRNIAFALGYMGGHGNGDIWAHTWVNKYAEGVFPDFTNLAESDISVRHLVVEGYVDKHRPGFEANTSFAIDAPKKFIADKLILSDFSKSRSSSPLYDFFFDLQDGLEGQEASVHQDNTTQDFLGECPFCVPDPTDSPLNLIELGIDLLIEQYLENWIEDIDRGLRDWVDVWEVIATELMTGKKANADAIFDAFEEWALRDLLSMLGLPDFVGEGIFLIGEIVDFIVGLITDVLSFIFDAIKQIPILGDLITLVEGFIDDVKEAIVNAIEDIVDKIAAVFITLALGFTDLNPDVKDAIDRNDDGLISPREVIRVIQEPEEYIEHPALFPTGTRAAIDTDMGLPPGTDDDAGDVFRDYNPDTFTPLYDTTVMGKLAMLDENGLNNFFKTRAGGNTAALGNLYGPHANLSGSWPVPNNVMTGWAKSLDAEYQWRVNSPNDGRSYGTGTMNLFEDCVARDRVFRRTFKQPVAGIDAFGDAGDPPSPISETVAPVSTLTLSGPNVTNSGQTFITDDTDIVIQSTDNYFDKPDLRVFVRSFAAAGLPPAYGAGVPADPAPFRLTGADGARNVQFFAVDGKGTCNTEAEQTRTFNLDGTPPVITVLSPAPPGASFASDVILPLNFTASDGTGSGVDPATARHFVDGVQVPGPPGSADLFDFPAGTHVYRAEQADLLGNVGSREVPWVTIVTAGSLAANLQKALDRGCISKQSTFESLNVKLQNAAAADERGNDTASDNILDAFKNEIAAQTDKSITAKCADVLTQNATALQAA